jgi:hypothetical protein
VGYALLATAASVAEALTGGLRLVDGCRMRGPSVFTLVIDGVVEGEGAWLTPRAGLPARLGCDGCDFGRGGAVYSVIVPEVMQRTEGIHCPCERGWP